MVGLNNPNMVLMKMSDFTIDSRQLKRLDESLSRAGIKYEKGTKRFLKKIAVHVQGLSRKYCPESPTIGQYAALNKSGVTKRKRSSITTGSLRDSITEKTNATQASIFIPANSKGGEYAEKMHDGKGAEWKKRGVRTIQKGESADEKFIFRAYNDSEKTQAKMIDDVLDELINGIGI